MKLAWLVFLISHFICGNAVLSVETDPPHAPAAEILRPLLNSERIKLKFGSYGIDVLKKDEKTRLSSLYSIEDGKKITRTFAVVLYPELLAPSLLKEHRQIVAGQSLGEVFKRNGWRINKKHLYFGEIQATSDLEQVYSLMGGISPSKLPVHIYEFLVDKGGTPVRYATIAEIHHPAYLSLYDLKAVYTQEFEQRRLTNRNVRILLEKVAAALTATDGQRTSGQP
ncbi:MAG: hypothetical protein ACU837_06405 [Gammaproteobacteria bacterium]